MALAAIPLMMVVTGALEMFSMSNDKALLQAATDAGALAGAGKLSLASYDAVTDVTNAAIATARQNVSGAHDPGIFSFTVKVDQRAGSVTVDGQAAHKSLTALLGIDSAPNASSRRVSSPARSTRPAMPAHCPSPTRSPTWTCNPKIPVQSA